MAETLREIINDALEAIDDDYDLNGHDCHDIASEIADSHTPVYTRDLMMVAANNIDLAVIEPEIGPAFDGSNTPVNIVAANIYEAIQRAVWEECDNRDKSGGMRVDKGGVGWTKPTVPFPTGRGWKVEY